MVLFPRRRTLLLLAAAVAAPALVVEAAPAPPPGGGDTHPSALMVHAADLFSEGEHEAAVFWFYAGQLRWRVHLAAHPELPADGEPAVFSALFHTIGPPINLWAFGDPPMLAGIIEEVLAWDAATPDSFTPRRRFAAAHDMTRQGLADLAQYLRDNADLVRAERAALGLENR